MTEAEEKTLKFLRDTADRLGYALNPDEKALLRVVQGLARNKSEHGRYYCPCKQHFPPDPKADPLCPCGESKDEISRDGHCECHVFFDAESIQAKRRAPGLLATVTCPG